MKNRIFAVMLIIFIFLFGSCDSNVETKENTPEVTPTEALPTSPTPTSQTPIKEEIKISVEYEDGKLLLERVDIYENGLFKLAIFERSFTYGDDGSIKGISYKNGECFEYTRDDCGRVLSLSKNGEVISEYEYSDQGYLIKEDNLTSLKTYVYEYDVKGNIIQKKIYPHKNTVVSPEEVYDYQYKSGVLESFSGMGIEYNKLGNPTIYGDDTEFMWGERLLDAIVKDGSRIEFTYGAFSMRSVKKAEGIEYRYSWSGTRLSALEIIESDGKTRNLNITYNSDGVPVTALFDDVLYYYITDAFGSVTGIASSEGIVVSYTYDAWGNILESSCVGDEYTELAEHNPIRYKGYVYDSETGLYYLHTRYYSPSIGRRLGADGYSADRKESYIYAENDPVNLLDDTMTVEHPICNNLHLYSQKEKPVEGKINVIFKPKSSNPVFQIENSYKITEQNQQSAILEYIMASDLYNADVYGRTLPSMLEEWRAHNHIYAASPNERCQHVDFDRNDEGVTYSEFWKRAAKEYGIEIK